MCSRANFDNITLTRYVIISIPDSDQNKCLAYDCTNLCDFKQKLKVYEKIR